MPMNISAVNSKPAVNEKLPADKSLKHSNIINH